MTDMIDPISFMSVHYRGRIQSTMPAYTKPLCVFLMVMMAFTSGSMAAEYIVGEEEGWNNIGTDYKKWAHKHNFRVGDVLVFNFNPVFHNVVRVASKKEFDHCEAGDDSRDHEILVSGNDRFGLKNPGNYYFYCSYQNNCEKGQKLHVFVPTTEEAGNQWLHNRASSPLYSLLNHLWLLILILSCALVINLF